MICVTQWLSEHWQSIVTILAAYFAFRAWIETMVEKRREVEESLQNYFNMNLPIDLRRYYEGRKLDAYPSSILVTNVYKIRYKLPRILLGIPNKYMTYFELSIAKKNFDKFSKDEINKLQGIYSNLVKELNNINNLKISHLGSRAEESWFVIVIQVFSTEPNKLGKILDLIGEYFDERF